MIADPCDPVEEDLVPSSPTSRIFPHIFYPRTRSMPDPTSLSTVTIEQCIDRWKNSSDSEYSSYAIFLGELSNQFDAPHTEPATGVQLGAAYNE